MSTAETAKERPLPLLEDLEDCPDCGGDGECFECSGTGHCSTCDGDGKTETSRAFCNTLYWDNGVQQRCDRRAPEDESEKWQCPEHRRQQAWAKQRTEAATLGAMTR